MRFLHFISALTDARRYRSSRPARPTFPRVLCKDAPGFDRTAFHSSFNQAVIAFFNQHLRS